MLHRAIFAELLLNTGTATLLSDPDGENHRIYPLVIPQKVPRGASQTPCVVYELRSVDRDVTYCGTIGLVRSMMQLDCYSPSYDTAKELAAAVKSALLDYRGMLGGLVSVRTANLETEFDLQDIEPGLYRVSQSWAFWHTE